MLHVLYKRDLVYIDFCNSSIFVKFEVYENIWLIWKEDIKLLGFEN